MSALTADRVIEIFKDCLFEDSELTPEMIEVINATPETPPEGALITRGIVRGSAFHAGRVEAHRTEILEMLHDLPLPFMATELGGGGGWSFLNGAITAENEQWTGDQQTVDQLFQLGMAIGAADYMLDREMWSMFPGGVPYAVVKA